MGQDVERIESICNLAPSTRLGSNGFNNALRKKEDGSVRQKD
jgi:hypothetical protein